MLRYRLFGNTGLRVSEICLGTMSFGDAWGFGADEEASHRVLDRYADLGGNFLDTANMYHGGQTEEFIGRWLDAAPGRRHRTVVGTKCTLVMDQDDVNSAGAHRKNLERAVDDSLRRLRTDHVDILWVHAWDRYTPMAETMRVLDDLIRSGRVRYIGVSDTPAWVVSASNVLAELRGWTPFAGIQIEHGLLARTPERDLVPMASHGGLSVLAWGALGGGVLTGKYTRAGDNDSLRKAGNAARGRTSARSLAIAREVDAVADDLGWTSAQVALAWLLGQGYHSIPIVGARRVSQLEDCVGAAGRKLPDEALIRLDKASSIELGFPHDFLAEPHLRNSVYTRQHARIEPPPRGR